VSVKLSARKTEWQAYNMAGQHVSWPAAHEACSNAYLQSSCLHASRLSVQQAGSTAAWQARRLEGQKTGRLVG
jgi:hypothetical protein